MTLWRRAGGLRGVGLVVVLAAILRVVQLLVVSWLSGDEPAVDRLLIWDGGWFINVAEEGYPSGYAYDEDGVRVGNGFAFFPVFPLLIRGVAALGIPAPDASLVVALVSGIVAAALIYLLGTALWSTRVGLLLMVLVSVQPMSVVLIMGYTEPLFLALVAGTLLAAHQRIWWLAGLLGVASALTRPTGVAVALALTVAVTLLWRVQSRVAPSMVPTPIPAPAWATQTPLPIPGWTAATPLPGWTAPTPGGGLLGLAAARTGPGAATSVVGAGHLPFADKGPVGRAELVWASVAAAASLLAGPAFLAWVGWRVGEWDAWFKVQTAGWGSTFDGGKSVAIFIYETLSGGTGMVELVTAWVIIGAVAFSVLAIFDKVWPPLLVYGLVGLVLVIGQAGYWHSKPRLLVPVLLFAAVPMAKALAKAQLRTALTLLAIWSAFGLWFGAYMITIWPFTI